MKQSKTFRLAILTTLLLVAHFSLGDATTGPGGSSSTTDGNTNPPPCTDPIICQPGSLTMSDVTFTPANSCDNYCTIICLGQTINNACVTISTTPGHYSKPCPTPPVSYPCPVIVDSVTWTISGPPLTKSGSGTYCTEPFTPTATGVGKVTFTTVWHSNCGTCSTGGTETKTCDYVVIKPASLEASGCTNTVSGVPVSTPISSASTLYVTVSTTEVVRIVAKPTPEVSCQCLSNLCWSLTGSSSMFFVSNNVCTKTEGYVRRDAPGCVDVTVDCCGNNGLHLRVVVLEVDLDIDSDHTTPFGGPDETTFEDEIEELGPSPHQALKYVVANDYYRTSMNGKPGYADFDMTIPDGPVHNPIIIPMKLKIPANSCVDWSGATVTFTYPESKPSLVTSTLMSNGDWQWPIPDNKLRIWTVQGPRNPATVLTSGGNYVPAGVPIPLSTLGLPGSIVLYLEGINPSESLGAEKIKVNLNLLSIASCPLEDAVNCTVIKVKVDVDNYNDSEFDPDVHTLLGLVEDHYEDFCDNPNHVGRLIVVDDDDKDMDAIPDFADGYSLLPGVPACITNTEAKFVPIVFEIPEPIDLDRASVRLTYSDSDPMDVTSNADGTYSLPDTGKLRIWTKPGNVPRDGDKVLDGGDFLASGDYTAAEFGFSSTTRKVIYYMEVVKPSEIIGDLRILFEVKPDERTGFIAADAVRVTAVSVHITPDFNRDGKIDDTDKDRLMAKGMFRFWINDDRDFGIFGTEAKEDAPPDSYIGSLPDAPWYTLWGLSGLWSSYVYVADRVPNCQDNMVNGVRDLVDFFPVRLDLPTDMLPISRCAYRLKQPNTAVKVAYTQLDPDDVKILYTNRLTTGFGVTGSQAAENAIVQPVTPGGVVIDPLWLALPKHTVIMIEGAAITDKPLTMVLTWDGHTIGSWSMGISVSSVSNMFRYLNVRTNDTYFTTHSGRSAIEGLWGTRLSEPANYPDGFYNSLGTTLKTLIAIHGLDWDESETPAGHSETFKRLFQSGMNGRYIGVSWTSDLGRVCPLGVIDAGPLRYANDVIGAFVSARYVKEQLVGFYGSDTSVFAHSLGNVLASSAIQDHGMTVGKYFMVNPAVPVEAYDGRANVSTTDQLLMIPPDWKNGVSPATFNYSPREMCAGWNTLFTTDPRSTVTWDGRFSGITTNPAMATYQFYSSGEEILNKSDGVIPSLVEFHWPWTSSTSVAGAKERVWVYHEMTKGTAFFTSLVLPNHQEAGWSFRDDYNITKLPKIGWTCSQP